MYRQLLLLITLALIPFVAVGCDKKTGSTRKKPANTGSNQPAKSSEPTAPAGIPPQIKAAVDRAWPTIEAAGEEIDAAFKSAQAARDAGNPPSSADVTRAKNAQAKTEEWAEIWNVLYDLADAGKITEADRKKTESYLRKYDKKIKKWNDKAKGIKELSTVK